MIKVFGITDKTFTSNGDCVIQPMSAKIKKNDNESYYLELEAGLEYADYLQPNRIIVADTPQGAQAFRIRNPEYNQRKVTLTAYHVYYDSQNYLIADSYVVDSDCNKALNHLNDATDTKSPFTVSSDIKLIDSYRCVREPLYNAINVVLERWGGHLVRDNWDIKILENVDNDHGITIRYAKNLQEINCAYDWDSVVTKLLPVGSDGILLNALNESRDIYIYSDVTYPIPFTKTVSFEQEIDEDAYTDADGNLNESAYKQALIDDLEKQAKAYIKENCVPKVNYTLKADVDRVIDVGEVIEVIDERLGISIMTSVIAFEYDCILGRYKEIEFGNFRKNLSNLVANLSKANNVAISKATSTLSATLRSEMETYTISINENEISLTPSKGAEQTIELPVYDGSVV